MFFVVYDFEPSNALSYFIKMFSVEMPVLGHPFKPISTSKKTMVVTFPANPLLFHCTWLQCRFGHPGQAKQTGRQQSQRRWLQHPFSKRL